MSVRKAADAIGSGHDRSMLLGMEPSNLTTDNDQSSLEDGSFRRTDGGAGGKCCWTRNGRRLTSSSQMFSRFSEGDGGGELSEVAMDRGKGGWAARAKRASSRNEGDGIESSSAPRGPPVDEQVGSVMIEGLVGKGCKAREEREIMALHSACTARKRSLI